MPSVNPRNWRPAARSAEAERGGVIGAFGGERRLLGGGSISSLYSPVAAHLLVAAPLRLERPRHALSVLLLLHHTTRREPPRLRPLLRLPVQQRAQRQVAVILGVVAVVVGARDTLRLQQCVRAVDEVQRAQHVDRGIEGVDPADRLLRSPAGRRAAASEAAEASAVRYATNSLKSMAPSPSKSALWKIRSNLALAPCVPFARLSRASSSSNVAITNLSKSPRSSAQTPPVSYSVNSSNASSSHVFPCSW